LSKAIQASDTPLMKQYNAIKVKYPGALLLFRVGDFYETFGEDAVKASKILGIVLTKRGAGSASEIALAGFPYHSLDNYLPKLVRAGHRVAICDQLEDPKSVKGIVKRGVTELVTPGVSFNENVLDNKQNNFLASIHFGKEKMGISFLDISTGEFLTSQGDLSYIEKLVQSYNPSEIIFSKAQKHKFFNSFNDKYATFQLDEWVFSYDYSFELLTKHFGTAGLKGFGIEALPEGITASGAILQYLADTEHNEIQHISSIGRIDAEKYVWLDRFTLRNLELVRSVQDEGISLLDVLDQTCTPMGSRLLKKWLVLPLKEKLLIEERLNAVEGLLSDESVLDNIQNQLKLIGDLERLISKVAVGRINPRELVQLKRSLKNIQPLKTLLEKNNLSVLKKFAEQLNPCEHLCSRLENELKEDVPIISNQGNIIKNGVQQELDDLRKIAFSGKDYLLEMQQREIVNTGINSLKIAFNRVFGYYLEVTHLHKDKVPADWIRKQTLVNAERYITEELKNYEETILTAEDKINAIEQRLFNELMVFCAGYVNQIQVNARVLAQLDCLCCFARNALKHNYTKPEINESNVLNIKAGRHPVIERQLKAGEPYVPNDIFLDDETQQIIIITGPNMAGKSALLRQTALIVLMAQMGSFVPAEKAEIGLIDKVFTRVGATDNLSKGESTFMVEMTETASILNNLSERSLVLMDEVGRGTSTYDGISIAWSIVEYLHNNNKFKPKTLFATHYHELNQLAADFPRVKNFNVSVKESGNKILFMRKLKEGGSEHSFGIHVAQMAGMPNSVVLRASDIMHHLEKDKVSKKDSDPLNAIPKNNFQLNIFEANDPNYIKVKEMLSQLDINTISPVEALLKLNEMKTILKNGIEKV